MVSFISHSGIGILVSELILRKIEDNSELRTEKRPLFWWAGFFGGLTPDLDFIPALFTGQHLYTYHHFYTHTFLAMGILLVLFLLARINPYMTRIKPYMLVFFCAYGAHLFVDFIDNSISPLGPFLPTIEWGLLCGWGEIPGGSWASEFWLEPDYAYDHDLWSIFMKNGWGIPINIEYLDYHDFLTYYDLAIIAITIPLIIIMIYLTIIKKPSKDLET